MRTHPQSSLSKLTARMCREIGISVAAIWKLSDSFMAFVCLKHPQDINDFMLDKLFFSFVYSLHTCTHEYTPLLDSVRSSVYPVNSIYQFKFVLVLFAHSHSYTTLFSLKQNNHISLNIHSQSSIETRTVFTKLQGIRALIQDYC